MNRQAIPAHHKLERSDFLWLGYLVFLLIEPVERHTARCWSVTFFATALFLILYFLFLRFDNLRLRLALLTGMYALGLATLPSNGGASTFMIYAAALLPFVLESVPWVMTILALQAAGLVLEAWHLRWSPFGWIVNIALLLVIGTSNIAFAQKHRSDCKLRMQQEEIEALAAVAERERIARDLHDVLGHTLSVIVLKAELANRLLQRELTSTDALASAPPASTGPGADLAPAVAKGPLTNVHRAQTEIADVERTARTALAEVREAIGGYRARGLAAEIDAARNTLAAAGVTLFTEGDLGPAALTPAEETVLALALREAITNIVRHAEATTCRLRLVAIGGSHQLSIQDNGQHAVFCEGNGLRGMRERVEALGGRFHLTSQLGTLLSIDLPPRALPVTKDRNFNHHVNSSLST